MAKVHLTFSGSKKLMRKNVYRGMDIKKATALEAARIELRKALPPCRRALLRSGKDGLAEVINQLVDCMNAYIRCGGNYQYSYYIEAKAILNGFNKK